jgi:hypothetical protein
VLKLSFDPRGLTKVYFIIQEAFNFYFRINSSNRDQTRSIPKVRIQSVLGSILTASKIRNKINANTLSITIIDHLKNKVEPALERVRYQVLSAASIT